jgi:hypothetical protein
LERRQQADSDRFPLTVNADNKNKWRDDDSDFAPSCFCNWYNAISKLLSTFCYFTFYDSIESELSNSSIVKFSEKDYLIVKKF